MELRQLSCGHEATRLRVEMRAEDVALTEERVIHQYTAFFVKNEMCLLLTHCLVRNSVTSAQR